MLSDFTIIRIFIVTSSLAIARTTSHADVNVKIFGKVLTSNPFSTLYGLSFRSCQTECRLRSRCQSVNYSRQTLACQMNMYTAGNLYNLQIERGVVHVLLKDWTELEQTQCGNVICTGFERCNSATEQCEVFECEDIMIPENGYKFGNSVNVGAAAVLDCNNNTYIPKDLTLPMQTRCQPNSTWSLNHLQCLNESYTCDMYLVSENSSGAVKAITASTFYSNYMNAEAGVLNGPSAWASKNLNTNQYLQVEFTSTHLIGAVATQGYADSSDIEYVTSYEISYSLDCVTYSDLEDSNGQPLDFPGNTDPDGIVINTFESPVEALCVQIKPTSWESHISIRLDILGCTSSINAAQYQIYRH